MLNVDYTWMYGFGGANDFIFPDKTYQKIYRFNTTQLPQNRIATDDEVLKLSWE